MYYVIKRHPQATLSQYISFTINKFIHNKKNDTLIFEIKVEGKIVRKWVKRAEVILLTQDKEYFLETLKKFKDIEQKQKLLVEEAQAKHEQSLKEYSETMIDEIENFKRLKESEGYYCLLDDA